MAEKHSDEFLISEFWRYYQENNIYPYAKDMLPKNGYPHSVCYQRRWGDWESFLAHLNLLGEDNWYKCDEKVLLDLYKSGSKQKILDSLMIKRSWSTINKKAAKMGLKRGHEATYGKPKRTKEFLIAEFWRFFNEYKRYPLSTDFMNNDSYPSLACYIRKFGGWLDFINELGIMGEDGWYKCDEIIVQKMYKENNWTEINEKLMIKRSEGTVNKKANSMGLFKRKYTDEELINMLIEFYIEFNRTPIMKDFLDNPNLPGSNVYSKRFGSWNNAIELAGLEVNSVREFINKDINVNELIKDYLNGMEMKDIRNKYGYKSDYGVYYMLDSMNIPRKLPKWNDNEIDLLSQIYPYEEWELVLDLLHPHSKNSITSKAFELGIKRETINFWTEEEEDILVKNYGNITTEKIAEMLPNRNYKAITTKAKRLGLKTREFWTKEEDEMLAELFVDIETKELESIFNRNVDAIQVRANQLGIKKDFDKYKEKSDKNKREKMIKDLQEFAKELDRTPHQIEIARNKNMTSFSSYFRHFGTYTKACEIAGLEPNKDFAKIYYSKNNDICLSLAELIITDFLIDHKVKFKKEVYYKDIMNDDRCGMKRCDWLINGILIEYFGFIGKDWYDKKVKEKRNLCNENGIRLMELHPKDINKLEIIFKEFIDLNNISA